MVVERGHTVGLVFIGHLVHHSLRLTGGELRQGRQDRLNVRVISSSQAGRWPGGIHSHGEISVSDSCSTAPFRDTRVLHCSSLIAASVLPSPAEEIHDSPRGTTTASMIVAAVP